MLFVDRRMRGVFLFCLGRLYAFGIGSGCRSCHFCVVVALSVFVLFLAIGCCFMFLFGAVCSRFFIVERSKTFRVVGKKCFDNSIGGFNADSVEFLGKQSAPDNSMSIGYGFKYKN